MKCPPGAIECPAGGQQSKEEYFNMLRYSLLFLLVAIVAGALGFFRAEFIASEIAWVLFVVFLVLFVVSLVMGRRSSPL
jgi:uncharacterized membrane protein YtjA (UPF0391 family)